MSHYILLTVEIGEALTEGDKTTTNHNATPETLTYGIGNIIIIVLAYPSLHNELSTETSQRGSS